MSSEIVQHKDSTRISMTFSRTLNLGNYESLKFEVGLNRDKKDEESLEAAFKDVANEVYSQLSKLESHFEKRKPKGGKS